MKIPPLRQIEFSPLLWREFLLRDSKWKNIKEFYPYLQESAKQIDYCKEIKIATSNLRLKKLINGYVALDLLEWDNKIWVKFKFWQLFEDLIGEIFRELLKTRKECTVVYVDKVLKGLDYVITNSQSKDGWKVGVQCKRYVGSALPKCKVKQVGNWSKGTSAVHLIEKGQELRDRWGADKKFVLVCFNAFRNNVQQEKRFSELKKSWDRVIVLDKNTSFNWVPYTYKINISDLEKIVNWC